MVKGSGPLGRDWDWNSLAVNSGPTLLEKHKPIFRDDLGKVKNIVASLHIDEDVKPVFYKPRQVPYTMRDKVNKELERLEETEPVAPIVSVMKPQWQYVRDYKVTVNKVTYPWQKTYSLRSQVDENFLSWISYQLDEKC